MSLSRRKVIILVLALVPVGVLVLLGLHPKVQQRAKVVSLKLRGQLPELAYADILRSMIPTFVVEGHRSAVRLSIAIAGDGAVSFQGREGSKPCPVLWNTPLGPFRGRLKDGDLLMFLISEQLEERAYDREPVVVREGDVVIDAGAHLGTFTRFALNRGARLVIAFEPEPVNIACFKQNLGKEIEDGRVILIEAAAWHSPGTLNFQSENVLNTGSPTVVEGGEITVPAVTVDDTIQRLGLDRVDFIKLDVEGSERHALEGARATLTRFGPRMVVCVYHRPDDAQVVPDVALGIRPSYRIIRRRDHCYFY